MYHVQHLQSTEDFQRILQLRYLVLRQPWQQPIETATDDMEERSVNAFIENEQGLVIACGRLQKNTDTTGQVRFMAVHPELQGQGLGKLIMDDLEATARTMALQYIELHARDNAVKFYEQLGYKIREKSYLMWGIIQHYLMEKEI